ncbi:ATP-binding protein [Candidatus Woesearchaeota archaeon]|nr:ATP-binding protein [Candidatus Woesearchaeota archaeon]
MFRIVDSVEGTADSIYTIIRRVTEDLERAELADLADGFETCIIEAIQNATRYAYGGDAEATVDFQYYRSDKEIKVSIRDFGAGFDYEEFKKTRILKPNDLIIRDMEALRRYGRQHKVDEGRLGLLIAELFMDYVEYKNNTLLMVKTLKPQPGPDHS